MLNKVEEELIKREREKEKLVVSAYHTANKRAVIFSYELEL